MFGSDFRFGGPVLAILCVATIFEVLNILFGYLMIIAGRVWLRSCIDIGLALVLGTCATIWIPRFGGMGLAAACSASFAMAVITLGVSLSVMRTPHRQTATTLAHTSMPKSRTLRYLRYHATRTPFVK
jgi:O-antigen/teichoic acid export membrane protein